MGNKIYEYKLTNFIAFNIILIYYLIILQIFHEPALFFRAVFAGFELLFLLKINIDLTTAKQDSKFFLPLI